MALKSLVKVSHLSNLSDARFCAGMGVELLGFGAIPGTKHYLTREVFQEIRGWIAGPRIVAELYGIVSPEQAHEVLETYAPDYYELAWHEYVKFRDVLNLPCIIYLPRIEMVQQLTADGNIAYIITEPSVGCNGILRIQHPVLSRVSSPDDLKIKMKAGCFYGFVLEAPLKTRAGVTSYDELGDLLEALETD